MFPSPIDQSAIDHHSTSNSPCQYKIIQSGIGIAITAAELLDTSMSDTNTRHKNGRWDEDIEVFEMMEFLPHNASKAGDGGNFPATWYSQAADHIAAFQSPDGNMKTGDQAETKYQFVFLQVITDYLCTNLSFSSNSNTSSSLTIDTTAQDWIGTTRRVQMS